MAGKGVFCLEWLWGSDSICLSVIDLHVPDMEVKVWGLPSVWLRETVPMLVRAGWMWAAMSDNTTVCAVSHPTVGSLDAGANVSGPARRRS